MKVRLRNGVRLRRDTFGGICYVPHRDDFFAANEAVFGILRKLTDGWAPASRDMETAYIALARLGICETQDPPSPEGPYSGPAFLGEFLEIPTVSEPLVLNCFCTAFCPLQCIYCHADDLMQSFRRGERPDDLDNVVSTARMINSLVVVVTGGDPLTRPERAKQLIEGLAGPRAVVLDTSGVGDIDSLLPALKRHNVHVRISLDAISPTNKKLRPVNRKIESNVTDSGDAAQKAVKRCLSEKLGVTVQTVVSRFNENLDELRDLRDWLVDNKVRNWVLHLTVKGGAARRIEDAKRKHKRGRGIVPSQRVYEMLQRIIEETRMGGYPLDIRCTDTDTTPNSVLLVSSTGSLYTEGYAHHGKVRLYDSDQGRPDTLQKLWHYVDRFGHARRYLNWNPNFDGAVSLEQACYSVPLPSQLPEPAAGIVEAEAKYRVLDPQPLLSRLSELGFSAGPTVFQRDEYYDTDDRKLRSLDYAVRVRRVAGEPMIVLKGPRNWTPREEYSRIELEFEAKSSEALARDLSARGLTVVWFFEKRRTSYRIQGSAIRVELDEIPELGFFVEIEGDFETGRRIAAELGLQTSDRERRNYQEIFLDFKRKDASAVGEILGARF